MYFYSLSLIVRILLMYWHGAAISLILSVWIKIHSMMARRKLHTFMISERYLVSKKCISMEKIKYIEKEILFLSNNYNHYINSLRLTELMMETIKPGKVSPELGNRPLSVWLHWVVSPEYLSCCFRHSIFSTSILHSILSFMINSQVPTINISTGFIFTNRAT